MFDLLVRLITYLNFSLSPWATTHCLKLSWSFDPSSGWSWGWNLCHTLFFLQTFSEALWSFTLVWYIRACFEARSLSIFRIVSIRSDIITYFWSVARRREMAVVSVSLWARIRWFMPRADERANTIRRELSTCHKSLWRGQLFLYGLFLLYSVILFFLFQRFWFFKQSWLNIRVPRWLVIWPNWSIVTNTVILVLIFEFVFLPLV